MAGESLVVKQRTFWRMASRRPPAADRVVRSCSSQRWRRGGNVRRARVRIHPSVRPEVAAVIREARAIQARLTHVLDCYARPHQAGGASLNGEKYAEAAAAGDLRPLRDVLVDGGAMAERITEVIQPDPTTALPGTAEKVEIMAKRHEERQDIHSNKDARRE